MLGSDPVKLFLLMLISTTLLSNDHAGGRVPVNEFELRARITSDDIELHEAGRLPVS